ncbi:MAG: hypothetical protein ACI9UT_002657 [Flavobacteriales bacterium]|jgi:hypothetical protein
MVYIFLVSISFILLLEHNARHTGEQLVASPSHKVADFANACYVFFLIDSSFYFLFKLQIPGPFVAI